MFWGKTKDEIIYCAAAVGIAMNVNSLKQRFMGAGEYKSVKGHTDDITSLGVCPLRKLVVTGSLGSRPLILVWDSDSMEIVGRANLSRNTRAVSTIRFTRDAKHFFCSDKHNDSNVYLFATEGAKEIASGKCGSDPIFDGEAGNQTTFAVATKRGMHFFNYDGNELDKKRGIFGDNPSNPMITVTFSPEHNTFFSGSSKGMIYKWDGNSCSKSVSHH